MSFLADPFWKRVDQSDALALFGLALGFVSLVLGVGSIWYSWYLARRDIREQLRVAREAAVAEAARSGIVWGLAECRHSLELAVETVGSKRWRRAEIYTGMSARLLATLIGTRRLTVSERHTVALQVDNVRRFGTALRGLTRELQGTIPAGQESVLTNAILAISGIEGRLLTATVEHD